MASRRCAVCSMMFFPRPQVPKQNVCSSVECQRERKRRWQQDKLRNDPDYRDNQNRANKAWIKKNPNYSREYRAAHPDYVERNRVQQRIRGSIQRKEAIAKMDVSFSLRPLKTGIYRLTTAENVGIAKMDAWVVQITVLSGPEHDVGQDCKEMT